MKGLLAEAMRSWPILGQVGKASFKQRRRIISIGFEVSGMADLEKQRAGLGGGIPETGPPVQQGLKRKRYHQPACHNRFAMGQ
jgi:hypothetical protein